MSEANIQDSDRIIAAMERMSGSFSSYANSLDKRKQAEETLSKDLFGKSKKAAEAMKELGTSASSASGFFQKLAYGTGIGALVGKLVTLGNELTKTYRDLSQVGSTFNGSLLNMSIAAASAGMPLGDFADAVKKGGASVRLLGERDFAKFQKQIRKNMMQHGMYGMTVEQITEYSTKHLETSRKSGLVSAKNANTLAKQFAGLTETTAGLSVVTGKAREAIMEMTSSAISASLSNSRIRAAGEKDGLKLNDQLQKSVAIMASQQGEAGEFLSGALANTFGMGGRSEFTDEGKTMIEAGLPQLSAKLNHLSKNLSEENTIEFMEDFRKEIGANIGILQVQAQAGNAQAIQLLKSHAQMEKMTKEDLRRAKKAAQTQDGLTKIFTTFGTWWDQTMGSFKEGFLKGFKPLFDSVGDFTKSAKLKRVQDIIAAFGEKLGSAMGALFTWILDPKTIQGIGDKFASISQWFGEIPWATVGAGLLGLAGGVALLAGVKWGLITAGIMGVASLFDVLSGPLTAVVNLMKEFPIVTGAVIAGLWAMKKILMGKALLGMAFGGKKTGTMDVKAGVVNINGGDGGGGSGSVLDDLAGSVSDSSSAEKPAKRKGRSARNVLRSPPRPRRRGVRGLASSLWGRTKGMGGRIKGLGAKGMMKAGGKSLLKKIPGVGALAGLGFGAQRAMSGDWLGAGGEVLSGLAGTIPGIGTAASLGIDAALMARDARAGAGGDGGKGGAAGAPGAPGTSKGIWGKLKTVGKVGMGVAAGGAGIMGAGALADMITGDGKDEAPKTKMDDPVVGKLDELIKTTKNGNDLMVRVSQSQAKIMKDQANSLNQIKKNA